MTNYNWPHKHNGPVFLLSYDTHRVSKFTEAFFNYWSWGTIRFQYEAIEAALSELRIYPATPSCFGSLGIFVLIIIHKAIAYPRKVLRLKNTANRQSKFRSILNLFRKGIIKSIINSSDKTATAAAGFCRSP
jgi:hypothetical protein